MSLLSCALNKIYNPSIVEVLEGRIQVDSIKNDVSENSKLENVYLNILRHFDSYDTE